jgi:hypothetical protein
MTAIDFGEASLATILDYSIRDAGDNHVVVGPLCNQRSDGTAARIWYFHISTCGPDKQFRVDSVTLAQAPENGPLDDIPALERRRMQVILAITKRFPKAIIGNFADEVSAARMCEMLWPGERITRLREVVKAEYRLRIQL